MDNETPAASDPTANVTVSDPTDATLVADGAQQPEVIQPALLRVPVPEGTTGPWPTLDMDGGDPSSWV